MAGKNEKERKILYAEETNGDSIIGTGYFLEILMILAAVVGFLMLIDRLLNNEINHSISPLGFLGGLLGVAVTVSLALRLGKALRAVGALVEKNAQLESAVRYLCNTHDVELHSFDEAPPEEIPGAQDDGFETMRIEEDGVHFRRAGATVKCPFCDHEQPSGGEICKECGQRFFFEE